MDHTNQRTLPAGRVAVRWILFLVFFHLLPVPWFIAVAGENATDVTIPEAFRLS